MTRGTTARNVRVPDELWQEFLDACREEGTSASEQIRDMMDVWLEGRQV